MPSPAQQGRKALAAELAALQAQHARQSAASQREARTLLDSRDSLQNEMSAARAATAEREAALHAEAEANAKEAEAHAREESRLQQELSLMQGAAAETEATLQQQLDSLAKEKACLQRDAKATQSDLARQLLTNVESHATEKARLQRELDILHAAAVKTEADLRLEAQMQSDEQGKLQRELSGLAVKHKAAAQAAQTAQEQVRDLEEQLYDLQEEHAEEVAQLEQQVKDVKAELAEQLAAEVEYQISLKGRMQRSSGAPRPPRSATKLPRMPDLPRSSSRKSKRACSAALRAHNRSRETWRSACSAQSSLQTAPWPQRQPPRSSSQSQRRLSRSVCSCVHVL